MFLMLARWWKKHIKIWLHNIIGNLFQLDNCCLVVCLIKILNFFILDSIFNIANHSVFSLGEKFQGADPSQVLHIIPFLTSKFELSKISNPFPFTYGFSSISYIILVFILSWVSFPFLVFNLALNGSMIMITFWTRFLCVDISINAWELVYFIIVFMNFCVTFICFLYFINN